MQQKREAHSVTISQPVANLQGESKLAMISTDRSEKGLRHHQGEQELQVSVLPLESIKLSSHNRHKRINSEMKFMHISKSKSPSSPDHPRIKNAKNIFFRGAGAHFVSEEKARGRLEETRMFERERRLNKKEIEKKVQRLVSPHLMREQQLKKFARTEEKRLLGEKKKFKRIKQKPNEQEIAIREKIMKKLLLDPKHYLLSGIAEQAEDFVSQIELTESKGVSLIPQTESEVIEQESSQMLKSDKE